MSSQYGEAIVEAKAEYVPLTITIPRKVAEAFGLKAGDTVDVDYFDTIANLADNYGDQWPVIAITEQIFPVK